MLDLGPHANFIVAAYAVTLLALGALTLIIVGDDREQRRMLADLERKGIRRRSAAKPKTPAAKTRTKKTAKAPAKRKSATPRTRKSRS